FLQGNDQLDDGRHIRCVEEREVLGGHRLRELRTRNDELQQLLDEGCDRLAQAPRTRHRARLLTRARARRLPQLGEPHHVFRRYATHFRQLPRELHPQRVGLHLPQQRLRRVQATRPPFGRGKIHAACELIQQKAGERPRRGDLALELRLSVLAHERVGILTVRQEQELQLLAVLQLREAVLQRAPCRAPPRFVAVEAEYDFVGL